MTPFEWIVTLGLIVPLGIVFWAIFLVFVANFPRFVGVLIATARLAKQKNVKPTE